MPKKVTTSPKLFIGMDIHKKSWKIHFATDISAGATKTFVPDPDKLFKWVNKHYKKHQIAIAYEAGCCGYSAARHFIYYGWDTFVVNPADIPRPSKMGVMKSDKIDAANIARCLKAGQLKKLIIPDIERECLRSLTRRRSQVVKNLRRIKHQIKSLLLYYNIDIPEEFDNPNWSKSFIQWLDEIEWNFDTIDQAFTSMLADIRFNEKQLLQVSKNIRAYCRKHLKKDYKLLTSVPGIGPITAAYILAEIGDIRRFNAFKKFAAYVGIIPNLHSSGDNTNTYGVNPRANRTVRSLIVEAAWVAIRIDPVLQKYYRKHAIHNSKAAIFKTARKLLSRIFAVITTETTYEVGLIQ